MAFITQRYCPECKRAVGNAVADYLCSDCSKCKDCGKKGTYHGRRCKKCFHKFIHKYIMGIEEAHKRAGNSKIVFKSKVEVK